MLLPLPRRSDWRHCFAHPARRISLPRYGRRVDPRIVLFEACSAFTRVTACTLALSPYFVTRFTRRLQTFRLLHACSGCFRLEQFAGWGLHPLESAALARRTPGADIGEPWSNPWRRAIVSGECYLCVVSTVKPSPTIDREMSPPNPAFRRSCSCSSRVGRTLPHVNSSNPVWTGKRNSVWRDSARELG